MNDKCTILVNTCDEYSDVWDLLFESIRVQWANCPYKFVLNTQEKKYSYKDMPIHVFNCKTKGKHDRWGERYRKVLASIDTPYVIPILDDFVLTKPVLNDELVAQAIEWMEKDSNIAVFYLHVHPNVMKKEGEYNGFGPLPQICDYKLTTAVGVWRKDILSSYIRDFESPWEWEVNASIRAGRYREQFFAMIPGNEDKELLSFLWGGAIRRGLWHTETPELAEKYGIPIDFSIRGFYDPDDPFGEKNVYGLRKDFPFNVVKPIFWRTLKRKIRAKVHYYRSVI